MIVEVNDAGEILVPAELVQAAPHTRLKADREGNAVILKPLAENPGEETTDSSIHCLFLRAGWLIRQ